MKDREKQIEQWAIAILQEMPVLRHKLTPIAIQAGSSEVNLLQEVLKFLYLIGTYQQRLSPSMVVDLAWHEFILCTRLYAQFCQENFGRFIHHTPGGEAAENQRKFLKTIQLYIMTFGEPLAGAWGNLAQEEWQSSQCGACKAD
ncbi:MAG: glycine-rich domain-containing protein [Flammeovirgaceae bacterium]